MKRYFFGGLIVGAAGLYFGWIAFFEIFIDFDLAGDGGSNVSTEKRYASPDGKHTAYRFIESGGGAAGWCFRCVGIDGWEENEVFRIVPAQTELELNWIDSNTLSVTYPISAHTTVWRGQPNSFDKVAVLFYPVDSKSDLFETEEK